MNGLARSCINGLKRRPITPGLGQFIKHRIVYNKDINSAVFLKLYRTGVLGRLLSKTVLFNCAVSQVSLLEAL